MKRLYHTTLLIVLLTFLHGCAIFPSADETYPTSLSTNQVAITLQQQHRHWKGVRYRKGGLSRKGIDCSGFVYLTFKDKMNITLPRTTELQAEVGKRIRKTELKAGDLVFFKTGFIFKSLHVGMYISDKRFLHASTSRGVMISSLANPYWQDSYWQSRRLLEPRPN